SVGEANYCQGCSWTIDTAYYVEVLDASKLNLEYFYYFADQFDITAISQKGVKPGVNRNDYLNIEIPLPSIEEQNAIVDSLRKV
ncbi:restriction endonuclease subunit S, partial [Escherichia coli]|nr:restriction endonuclease subunit S [Escherichia coli]